MFYGKLLKSCALAFCLALCGAAFAADTGAEDFFDMCRYGSPLEVGAAIKAGADVNAADEDGVTPLMLAAIEGNLEVIAVLLEAGADVNAKDGRGMTPLLYAGNFEHLEALSALLKAGADPNAEYNGQTLRELAVQHGAEEIVSILDGRAPGAPREAPPTEAPLTEAKPMEAALMSAEEFAELCESGALNEVEAAIRGGVDVNARIKYREKDGLSEKDGLTALMYAAVGGSSEIVSALIKAGADVNAADEDGFTPLMLAVWFSGSPEAVSILLDAGADVSMKNADGKRAIDFAGYNEALKGTESYKMLYEASGRK